MPAPKPPEFRQRAVELARERAKPIRQIALDLGIGESCLRRWMDQARAPTPRPARPRRRRIVRSSTRAAEKPRQVRFGRRATTIVKIPVPMRREAKLLDGDDDALPIGTERRRRGGIADQ